MFDRLLWLKLHEIMQRLNPPAQEDETVGDMHSRALAAGVDDARHLMMDASREDVMREARLRGRTGRRR